MQSQLDIRTANFFTKVYCISENSLCYIFSSTARRQLNELFAQFVNVATASQFHNAIFDSFTYLNGSNTDVSRLLSS